MSLAELCVRRPVFATMLVMFLVVLGIVSFMGLGVDLFPKSDQPVVQVLVNLPGSSPEEIVSQVVLPLEEQIAGISGIDELDITVFTGQAKINCRFVLERNVTDAAQDVREKVALAMKQLPVNVEPPIITKADPDLDPVLTLAIGGPRPLREITEIADKQIKRQLQTVDGVASIDLVGGRPREIQVLLDAERLSAHRLTANQVESTLTSENIESPGGTLYQGPAELAVRTLGRFETLPQIERLVVANLQGAPVHISDVAGVEDTSAIPQTLSRLDGAQAVTLQIRRQSGTNTVQVADDVRAKLKKIMPTLAPDLNLQWVSDQSVFIRASVEALQEHLLLGSLLASLIVFLFIRNWRAVLVSSLAIPTSIIATFTVMKIFDFTLNNMTLLALTLAVGIVIDDAIVVLENIFRHMEELGKPPFLAAVEGTKEITLAVMATTLSLVIIFVPIAFMTGYAQKYLYSFGMTMTFAILVSMLVSFTLTPMLSARFLGMEKGGSLSKQTRFFTWFEHHYERLLHWALDHPKTIVAISAVVFLAIFPLNAVIGRDWIPVDDQSEFTVHVDLPEGTSFEGVTRFAEELEPRLRQVDGVDHLLSVTQGSLTHIHFIHELKPLSERKLSNVEIATRVQIGRAHV